jgi:hypothetical protein
LDDCGCVGYPFEDVTDDWSSGVNFIGANGPEAAGLRRGLDDAVVDVIEFIPEWHDYEA